MLKVAPLKKTLFSEGTLTGTPCVLVDCQSKEDDVREVELNDLFPEILNFSKFKYILVKGFISQTPEIKPLLEGLVGKGKHVIFMTDASEELGPVRSIKNVRFFLNLVPPTPKVNTVNLRTLTYMTELDEIKVVIKSLEDYENGRNYVKSKTITRPTILFGIHRDLKGDKELVEVVNAYLEDSETFGFSHKLSTNMSLG